MLHLSRLRFFIAVAVLSALAVSGFLAAAAQESPKPSTQEQPQKKDEKKKDDKRRDNRQDSVAKPDLKSDETDPSQVVKIDTDLVELDVFVIDQTSAPVTNLTKENFSVFEDKIKQEIEAVDRKEVPLSFGLVIDTSGSMRSKLQTVTDAGLGLIRSMQKDDEGFVAQFKAEPELVQDFTQDKRELEDAMGELFTSSGTALLDAIIATADYAQEKAKNRRRAIIVITDGVEKNSVVKEKEVLEAIKEDEVQIYLVGFIDEDEGAGSLFGKNSSKRAKDLLIRIAEDSGGRHFFPKDISEMADIAKQIAKDLRTQYVVSYSPTNPNKDGTFRRVSVDVKSKDNRKLIARTRQGYYARKEKPQP
jgi:Ca-activated chloride channel family protein